MNVLVLQPGFPAEIPYFVRGLSRMGARVLGVGDQPASALAPVAREALDHYLQVPEFWDAKALTDAVRAWPLPIKLDLVVSIWEATMELAAQVRSAFGLPGLTPDQTLLFRDKFRMRQALEQAGIRNPRFARAQTKEQVFQAAEKIGFPLIIKPIAGAGSKDTFRVNDLAQLQKCLPAFSSASEVAMEEFVEGDEYTFDTICANGKILFYNILRYRPTMLQSRSIEQISPQNMILRDLSAPLFRKAYALGEAVIKAMGYRTGFTHMEWFHKPNGEVVFGEIGARPPGGMTGELMNYSCDFDVYNAWAEALLHGRISQNIQRKYNVAMIFKRAHGQGRIQAIQGLEALYRQFGDWIVRHEFLSVGAPRRNWRQTILSDGYVILRHPDLAMASAMSEFVAEKVHLYAG